METILTYHYRIKDNTVRKVLIAMSSHVNFVWNFTCDVTKKLWSESRKYTDLTLLSSLTRGSSRELMINSQTIQATSEEVISKTKQFKKQIRKRSRKRKLGWVPFKGQTFKFLGNYSTYNGFKIRYWYHRPLPKGSVIKSGNFSEDSQGRWYLNLVVSFPEYLEPSPDESVGIDLGIKTIMALSTGEKIERESISKKLEVKLAKAQRHRKKKQVTKIHAKIRNKREDWNHKKSFNIAKRFKSVFVGDTTPSSILSEFNKINRSIYDASWYTLKTYLAYKVIRRQGCYLEVPENDIASTETCSSCFNKAAENITLRVREWTCGKCNSIHDRDINAARNHLRFGHETLRLAKAS